MEDNTNLEIVQSALGGDPLETERLFATALEPKIMAGIDNMRKDVALNYLTPQEMPDENSTE